MLIRPQIEIAGDKLRALIDPDPLRIAGTPKRQTESRCSLLNKWVIAAEQNQSRDPQVS